MHIARPRPRGGLRLLMATLLTGTMAIGMGVAAIAAQAQTRTAPTLRRPDFGLPVHFMLTDQLAARYAHSPDSVQSNLVYHGGLVMRQAHHAYVIFWEPKKLQNGDPAYVSPDYNSRILQYFKDLGGTGLYNNNTQYYQVVNGQQQHIKNVADLAASWVDTGNYPASGCTDPKTPGNCLTDAQIQQEVTHAISVNGWSTDITNGFFVFTARGEGSCFSQSGSCFLTTYCAYHGAFGNTIYANMPYGQSAWLGTRSTCTRIQGQGQNFPYEPDTDIEVNITSHEEIEMTTDPHLNAWFDQSGEEIGDLCVYNYGTKDEDNGKANQLWNGTFYLMQMEWDNAQSGCAQEGP